MGLYINYRGIFFGSQRYTMNDYFKVVLEFLFLGVLITLCYFLFPDSFLPSENWTEDTDQIKRVLVAAYYRSGSSFTGEGLRHSSENTFYVFEMTHFIRINSNITDKMKNEERAAILQKVFKCNFADIPLSVLKAVSVFHQNYYQESLVSRKCFVKPTYNTFNKRCLVNLSQMCKNASVIVAKEIDFGMSEVLKLAKKFLGLKIIHLVRDPRGMINSVGNLESYDNLLGRTRGKCNLIKRNIEVSLKYTKENNANILPVFYECLATNPYEGFQKIYDFAGLAFTRQTDKWIEQNTHISRNKLSAKEKTWHLNMLKKDKKASDLYQTKVESAISSAYRWRIKINPILQQSVDLLCIDVYNHLGLVAINTQADLRNMEIGLRKVTKTSYISNFCGNTSLQNINEGGKP